ncbi:phosphoribosylanthranilate isomerase [Intestinimonas sp. HCP28S3_D6]|uniref:phosphoribosylanthranilate isomerase n=1 Tax=Intestinimonas sp. HCP28S3_D6 TaxID=3438942 RepID=UPI003F8B7A0D
MTETKIKLCGLSRLRDIRAANALRPDFVGFVFALNSRRYVSPQQAKSLKSRLAPGIQAVGVFVDEEVERVAELLGSGVIDLAQLHGTEDNGYIRRLRALTDQPLIQAFRVRSEEDVRRAADSGADHILLDAGAGTGTVFDWRLLRQIRRPYFLAGGLGLHNVEKAVEELHPYGVDVSSGIETDGVKDPDKMAAFVAAVRKEGRP